jgi:2-C-methyl-D-erythritol 2,4-cyclodiphosphate synthase
MGYDLHRLVPGRKLVLGGVKIPSGGLGLLGHSDADALLHAVCDAILGAAGLGDIGRLFPDTNPKYRNAASKIFVAEAMKRARAKGFKLGNLDCVVIAQQPKLAPFHGAIQKSIAKILACKADQVSVKAKTNEGLGYLGRKEGIAVYCVVLLERGF